MFRSLRSRLALSHAVVLAVILLMLGFWLQLLLARTLDRSATDDLRAQVRGQVENIVGSGQVQPPVDSDVPSAASVQMAIFRAPDGTLVGESTETPVWLKPYLDPVTDLTVAGEHVRVVTVPVVVGGTTVAWVAAGRSLAAEDRLLHQVRLLFLAGGVFAIIASFGAGWWLAGRAVRPVERAYEAQAGFAADASHELRTPLAFIRSGVEVLAEGDPELGRDVLADVDYLTGLTQRLLSMARAEGSTVTLERGPIDVVAICRSAARRSEVAHADRLILAGPDDLAALGDRVGLEAALDAVLENVHEHGEGAAELTWSGSEDEAVIGIVDHGPGLPPELADRAFERFFRADPSRARETGGAGLGLSLARALIEAQGGRMWVEETPGGGLTAKIALPLPRP
jgi:signal transduction histidine kinase